MNEHESNSDLLSAADLNAATVERRQSSKKRVKRDRRKGVQRSVGLEISPSGIALAIVENGAENETGKLILERVPFPRESGPARGDWSDGTLREKLAELVAEYQLSGQAVVVGLGGDPCLTRVVVGENDDVDSEVAELKERTDRYIGMGRGEKVSCETSTRIDAKRKRVWVTVAMRHVVEEVAAAIQFAGMRLAHMEHTMLLLCQVLQTYEQDTNEPVLLIVDELGRMDLGISYQGQLLLDYRPAMPDQSVSQGFIIQRHVKCLRRYVSAQMPNLNATLSNIFVTGMEQDRQSLCKSLDEQRGLERCHFPVQELCEGFEVIGEVSEDAGMLAAIGIARHPRHETLTGDRNNLMSTIRETNQIPWLSLLGQAWPIAAAVLVAIFMALAGNHQQNLVTKTEEQIESLSTVNVEAKRIRFVLDQREQRKKHVETIRQSLGETPWTTVLWKTGAILPSKTWLDSVDIDHDGRLRLVGGSFDDASIYLYIDQLKATGMYSSVALDATNMSRLGSKQTYRFEISAQISPAKNKKNANFAGTATRSSSRG